MLLCSSDAGEVSFCFHLSNESIHGVLIWRSLSRLWISMFALLGNFAKSLKVTEGANV